MPRSTADEVKARDRVVKRFWGGGTWGDVDKVNEALEKANLPRITNWANYRKSLQRREAKAKNKGGKKDKAAQPITAVLRSFSSNLFEAGSIMLACYIIARVAVAQLASIQPLKFILRGGLLTSKHLREFLALRLLEPLAVRGDHDRVASWRAKFAKHEGKRVCLLQLLQLGQYHPVFPEVESWPDVGNAALGKVLYIQARLRGSELRTWLDAAGLAHNDPGRTGSIVDIDREHLRRTWSASWHRNYLATFCFAPMRPMPSLV